MWEKQIYQYSRPINPHFLDSAAVAHTHWKIPFVTYVCGMLEQLVNVLL